MGSGIFAALSVVFVLAIVFAIAAVHLLFAVALTKVYGRRRAWLPFLIGAYFLLALIWIDTAYIVLLSVHAVANPLLASIFTITDSVVYEFPGNSALMAFSTDNIPNHHLWWLRVMLSAGIKGLLITPFALIARGFANDVVHGSEPAFVGYPMSQAFRDLFLLGRYSIGYIRSSLTFFIKGIRLLTRNPLGIILSPVIVLSFVILFALPAFAAMIMLAFIMVLHVASFSVLWGIYGVAALAMTTTERVVIRIRSGYVKCPYSGCYRPIPLPIFHCPQCNRSHSRLIPGRYGLLFRVCLCGRKLPTLYLLRKGRLPSSCPECGRALTEDLFDPNFHVPIYGGVSSGKTMFMSAAVWQMVEGHAPGIEAELIDDAARQEYEASGRRNFETGITHAKTTEVLPNAYLLNVRRVGGQPVSLYIYDAAGEAGTTSGGIDGHTYLKHFDGLAILVDPFAIPSVANGIIDRGGELPASASRDDPYEIVTRILISLERHGQLDRREQFDRMIAVVVTKADEPEIQKALGVRLDQDGEPHAWSEAGAERSSALAAWFERNCPALATLLATRFREVRYFAVSALGHNPDDKNTDRKHFTPQRVMEPFRWLLSHSPYFERPKAARIRLRLAEFATYAIVILAVGGISRAGIVAVRHLIPRPTPWICVESVRGEVGTVKLNVRDGPSPRAPVTTEIVHHEPVCASARFGSWISISSRDDTKGWVTDRFLTGVDLSSLPPPSSARRIVNSVRPNIRSGPGTKYPPIGRARLGELLLLREEVDRWVRVYTEGGLDGWIAGRFVGDEQAYGRLPENLKDGMTAYERQNYATARRLLWVCAERGIADAQFLLGSMYEEGKGGPTDYGQAKRWYQRATDRDMSDAHFRLGVMYLEGRGAGRPDYRQASEHIQIAANQGVVEAQTKLGWMYENGRGELQDYVYAHVWYSMAARSDEAARLKRDALAEDMTAGQKAEAEELFRKQIDAIAAR